MKYFDKLRNLEQEIIRLDSVESILRVLGSADASRNDMLNVVWYLDGAVEDINKNLSEHFYELFNEIRDDVYREIDTGDFADMEASIRFKQILEPFIPKDQ